MEGISRVQVATPQKNNNTKRNLMYAGISGGAGLGTWACSNHLTNKELSSADAFMKETAEKIEKLKQQVVDENKIRQELAEKYLKGKPITEELEKEFEKTVKSKINLVRDEIKMDIDIAQKNYESCKQFAQDLGKLGRRHALKNGVRAAVIVGSALAIFTVVKNMITSHSHKKEA